MFDQLFGGKAWYKSMVGWGIFAYLMGQAVVPAGTAAGVLNADTAAVLTHWLDVAAPILSILGIRRRLPAEGTVAGS